MAFRVGDSCIRRAYMSAKPSAARRRCRPLVETFHMWSPPSWIHSSHGWQQAASKARGSGASRKPHSKPPKTPGAFFMRLESTVVPEPSSPVTMAKSDFLKAWPRSCCASIARSSSAAVASASRSNCSSMHTSGYEEVLRPSGFRLNIARWPCPLEYEQPLGTHPSAPASTFLRSWCSKVSPVACMTSCTAAEHSLSTALRWPSGQPVNCPGSS
mmetsp:Transcript_36011/g.86349  ORF Transcript_36011/g.86349 Transcript_36011/m.86349 type:complete len:214 (+) Transcript_36011:508-1149(+)